ncbi:MAG: hypothetical protein JST55_13480 [Bacteroidetes bacterium]|nr:hypothetical protein [Bacteroidota bacterium]
MKVNEIFIAGGLPTVTYNPREDLQLERKLTDFFDIGNKLISVTGPTKTGKTVLCSKLFSNQNLIKISGGSITSEDDFWEAILHDIDAEIYSSSTQNSNSTTEDSAGTGGGLNVGVIKIDLKKGEKESTTTGISKTSTKVTNVKLLALKELLEQKRALLIDDFHYIDSKIQIQIIRALKQPIFNGLKVMVLAVPHRAEDSTRAESEMTGRVAQLQIPFWNETELKDIANKGFKSLNVYCKPTEVELLATESFGSPHLMQEFCYYICINNGITSTVVGPTKELTKTTDEKFFKEIVDTIASKTAFDRLAVGPRQRTDRMKRKLKNGQQVDIYTATLHAIAATGPKTEIVYEDLRSSMRKVLDDSESAPQRHEITRVLKKMDEIAKKEIKGEPVIDWDNENSKLFISDPFFAFYLKWAVNE